MPTLRKRATPNATDLVAEVVNSYVHRLFPELRNPAYLACPDPKIAAECIRAITQAAEKKGVPSEAIDLRPALAKTLDNVTAQLRDFNDRSPIDPDAGLQLVVLDGFDRLEGRRNDAPTYPFRSKFQFDQEHLWLFVGQDWGRLARLFSSYKLPLYHAAWDITPSAWRTTAVSSARSTNP